MRHQETMKVSTKCTSVTLSFFALISNGTGGGGTSLQDANGDVLDGVAFSGLD